MQLTIEQLFLNAVTVTENNIIIDKSSLSLLSLPATNAERLLIALLLNALEAFQGEIKTETGEALTDGNGNAITYDNSEIYELLSCFRWGDFLTQRNSIIVRSTIVVQVFTPHED